MGRRLTKAMIMLLRHSRRINEKFDASLEDVPLGRLVVLQFFSAKILYDYNEFIKNLSI